MTLAVAWALNRKGCSDDYLIVNNMLLRVSAVHGDTPLSAVTLLDSPESTKWRAIHLTSVAENLGSVVTHEPRWLELTATEYRDVCERAVGFQFGGSSRWVHDTTMQQIVLRVLSRGQPI